MQLQNQYGPSHNEPMLLRHQVPAAKLPGTVGVQLCHAPEFIQFLEVQYCVDATILLLAPNWLHGMHIQTKSHSQNQTHCGVRGKDTAKARLRVTEQRTCVFLLFGLFQPLLPLTDAQLHYR